MTNTLLIELKDQKALGLLKELEQLDLIKLLDDSVIETQKKASFAAIKLDTKGQTFNRQEANER